jgi:hypothetical protein
MCPDPGCDVLEAGEGLLVLATACVQRRRWTRTRKRRYRGRKTTTLVGLERSEMVLRLSGDGWFRLLFLALLS